MNMMKNKGQVEDSNRMSEQPTSNNNQNNLNTSFSAMNNSLSQKWVNKKNQIQNKLGEN